MRQQTAIETETDGRHDAYEKLLQRCRDLEPVTTAVAYPCEQTALTGAVEAAEAGLISPILVGPREKIEQVAKEAGLKIEPYPIEDVPESHAAAAKAVEICGTKSGRTIDKLAESGLTVGAAKKVKAPIINECALHYECNVVCYNDVDPMNIHRKIIDEFYPQGNFHRVYFGEVVACYGDNSLI